MAVRSLRMVTIATIPHGATTTVYVAPAGRTAIMHTIVVANRSPDARRFVVAVRSATDSASIGRNASVPPDTAWAPAGGPWVLNPGDALEVFSTGAAGSNLVSVYASGSLLLGAPE